MAGSIEKRGENTYRLVYACGYNLDGSIAKYTKTVHCSKKEAEIEFLLPFYSVIYSIRSRSYKTFSVHIYLSESGLTPHQI